MQNKIASTSCTDVIDQYSDNNFKMLHGIMHKLADDTLIEMISAYELNAESLKKVASDRFCLPIEGKFPVHTPEDTALSKLYFDHQRSSMEPKIAEAIESTLGTFCNLHGIPESAFTYHEGSTKTASENSHTAIDPIELLPSRNICKVASVQDLDSIAHMFTSAYNRLAVPERVEFCHNFVKAASALNYSEFPTLIAKYASATDTDLDNMQSMLETRALLAQRCGKTGDGYTKLASMVDEIEVKPSPAELKKLAETIHDLDSAHGFDAPKYDRHIPDAFVSVFNKLAEGDVEDKEKIKLEKMDKPAIIARFGVGVLEEVEDEDGEIDYDRLKEITKTIGAVETWD